MSGRTREREGGQSGGQTGEKLDGREGGHAGACSCGQLGGHVDGKPDGQPAGWLGEAGRVAGRECGRFGGIVVPIATPCGEDEALDEDLLGALADGLLKKGVHGMYICGGTGDGANMLPEERRRASELLLPKLRRAGRAAIVHVGQANLRTAVALAEHAGAAGANAVAAIPPRGTWGGADEYYRALAGAGLPTIVYYIPAATGMAGDFRDIAALLEIPGVEGIKVSDWNVFLIRQIKAAYPERSVFSGYDEMLLHGLSCGADGSIGTWAQIFPALYLRVYSLARAGRWSEARAWFDKFAAFLAEGWRYGILPVFEAIMARRGFPRCFRRPLGWAPAEIPPAAAEALDGAAAALEAGAEAEARAGAEAEAGAKA
ncbi:MAG: dihydrodipicolinate synthase family protein [Clostridiales bacterium]|jgi:dihydrodipicolinate synthase/N-acetylneuraminate lyase|nr:dihydrodipicolinate synthase family protein [Clostridiales bacterium]